MCSDKLKSLKTKKEERNSNPWKADSSDMHDLLGLPKTIETEELSEISFTRNF